MEGIVLLGNPHYSRFRVTESRASRKQSERKELVVAGEKVVQVANAFKIGSNNVFQRKVKIWFDFENWIGE